MNNEEAIKRLKQTIEWNNCDVSFCDGKCEKCVEAQSMAVEALEKQILKKPKEAYDGLFFCPACGTLLGDICDILQFKHCLDCGQKIDWSDEE